MHLLRCNALRPSCLPLYYSILRSSQAERISQQLEQKFTGGNRENGVGFDPEAQFGHGFFRGSRRWSRILKYHPDIFDHGCEHGCTRMDHSLNPCRSVKSVVSTAVSGIPPLPLRPPVKSNVGLFGCGFAAVRSVRFRRSSAAAEALARQVDRRYSFGL